MMTTTIRRLLLLVACSALFSGLLSGLFCGPFSGVFSSALGMGTPRAHAQDNPREESAPDADDDAAGDEVDEDVNAEGEVRDEGGSKVKVYRFGGLDISGRLKSPQLLYFLNRLRAEFDRPKLPHRSFIPELERSTKGRDL